MEGKKQRSKAAGIVPGRTRQNMEYNPYKMYPKEKDKKLFSLDINKETKKASREKVYTRWKTVRNGWLPTHVFLSVIRYSLIRDATVGTELKVRPCIKRKVTKTLSRMIKLLSSK